MRTVSTIRFTGMASGLDTESIVSAMVMPDKLKVDSARQDKQLMEWKQELYKEVSSKVYNFYTKTVSDLRLQSTFSTMKTSISNPNAITISGGLSSAPEGTHSIKVNQLAEGAMVPSNVIKYKDSSTGETKIASSNTKLTDIGFTGNEGVTIETENGPVTVRLGDVKLNSKGEPIVDSEGNQVLVETIGDLESQMQMKLKGTDINFKFDSKNGAFMISSKKTGANQKIEIKDADGGTGVLDKMQLKANTDGSYVFTGKDAEVIYNDSLVVTSSTNNIEVNGLKFTAVNETTEAVKIVATRDTDKAVEFVKNFVKEYNEILDELNTLSSTRPPKHGEYRPLTDEQRAEMSESEIEKWEAKAKEGLLYNDPVISSLVDSMRNIMNSVVEGNEFGSLSAIGVSPSKNWKDKGKLTLDEDKLRQAIETNAEDVMKLFTHTESGGPAEAEGIGHRLHKELGNRFKSTSEKSAHILFNDKLLSKNIASEVVRIRELEERMARMEDLYYKKFTAMEKALAQMNSQSSFLLQQSSY